MLANHFIADNLPANDGYTWTLPSRLGAILLEAEQRFGKRDLAWTVLGIEFGPGIPQIWFPGDRKNIVIQLQKNALQNAAIACFQLAHECIHLLAPEIGIKALVIEEGLATAFSLEYVDREFGKGSVVYTESSYRDAAEKTTELLNFAPDAIKKLRAIEPAFHRMTYSTFIDAGIDFPESKVTALLSKFIR